MLDKGKQGWRNADPGTSLVGPVVKNLPSNTEDMDSVPGQGTKTAHAVGQLSPRA